jgi:predicted metalloprotease with PDZ domain
MVRAFLLAAAALLLLGAKAPPTVDYKLSVEPQAAGQSPLLDIEIRFRGDADGETRLALPSEFADTTEAWRYVSGLTVKGARMAEDGPGARILRHKPNAAITVRYRVQTAYPQDPQGVDRNPYKGPILRPTWLAAFGEFVFAAPEGREDQAATFRWGKLPAGWSHASDLEHGAMGRPMRVFDVLDSVTLAGAGLAVLERPITGGTLRVAAPPGVQPQLLATLADRSAATISAERSFWNDVQGPYLVAFIPLTAKPKGGLSMGGTGRSDGFTLYSTPGVEDRLGATIAHEHTHTWIPARVGQMPKGAAEAGAYWFGEGFTDFFTWRTLLRAGQASPDETVALMADAMRAYDASPVKTAPNSRIVADFWKDQAVQKLPYQRGALLALKWDEDVRRKSGGKLDLDDVILRMRDQYQRFTPGQGPDVVTNLVSAAWGVAGIDLRPDIETYATGGAAVVLPDEMFDGCLQARVTVSPAFDAGFDTDRSFAAKKVIGVRRRGPAWNSGLRDGMALDAWTYKAGDTSRMVELTLRPAGRAGRPKVISYWPYGDATTESRKLQLTPGMNDAARIACGRKIGGL